jgi:uncharacterized delta-60 repeat protein
MLLLACVVLAGLIVSGALAASGGALDPTFGNGGKVVTAFGGPSTGGFANAVAVQSNGQIVAAGLTDENGSKDFAVVRYRTTGALDPSFGSGGKVITDFGSLSNDAAAAVAIQADGKIVVVGTTDAFGTYEFALVRYTTTGALDPSFGRGGKSITRFGSSPLDEAAAVAIQADGKIVVAGSSEQAGGLDRFAIARFTTSGTLDPSFGTIGRVLTSFRAKSNDEALSVAIQPDGKIVAAGTSEATNHYFALARYTTTGALDPSFGSGGKVRSSFGSSDTVANALALQTDGRIVVSGYNQAGGGTYDFALARYTTTGALDPSFGSGGKVLTDFGSFGFSSNDKAHGVVIQPNGKIVAAGESNASGNDDFALARYTAAGALDPNFGTGGKVLTDFGQSSDDRAAALVIENDKLLAAGSSPVDTAEGFALARYTK